MALPHVGSLLSPTLPGYLVAGLPLPACLPARLSNSKSYRESYVLHMTAQDEMHYWVDNMFRPDKAPYCSNCTRDADCIALLLVSGGAVGGRSSAGARRPQGGAARLWACGDVAA